MPAPRAAYSARPLGYDFFITDVPCPECMFPLPSPTTCLSCARSSPNPQPLPMIALAACFLSLCVCVCVCVLVLLHRCAEGVQRHHLCVWSDIFG